MTIEDFRNKSPEYVKTNHKVEDYLYFDGNKHKSPSPIKKEDGLTPKASKHYEGVKNLYW